MFYRMVSNRERIHNSLGRNVPTRAKQIPSSFICKDCKPNFNGNSFFFFFIMAQSIPRVPIPPPPGICHFVLEKLQCGTVGLKNIVQIPHPGTTPKLYFRVNKLKIPFLWEISNSPIKTCEPPTQIAPSS